MSELKKIKGIGPNIYKKLIDNKIDSISKLLSQVPTTYTNQKLSDLRVYNHEKTVNIYGKIIGISKIIKKVFTIKILLETNTKERYTIYIFNQRYYLKVLKVDMYIFVSGKLSFFSNSIAAKTIRTYYDDSIKFLPYYHLNKEIPIYRKIIMESLKNYTIKEMIPEGIIEDEKTLKLDTAIRLSNSPKTDLDIQKTIARFKLQEAIYYLTRTSLNRQTVERGGIYYNADILRKMAQNLPFSLRKHQILAINKILNGFKGIIQKKYLLAGDVGSGKTIVAFLIMALLAHKKRQSVMLVPTTILANQHYQNYVKLFGEKGVTILTSNTPPKEKREIIDNIKNGTITVVIGTTSIESDDIKYNDLKFIVIDEQHKFGILQREKIAYKGNGYDVLLLSATPIPKTLAVIAFSDLELITLDSKKENNVITVIEDYKTAFNNIEKNIKETLDKGEKVFIISPSIDTWKSIGVTDIYNLLKKYFKDKVYLLHGKMSKDEQDKTITDFAESGPSILVATQIVEVGIDIKEASLMYIIDANHFGLAQLHQLRGRIGRNDLKENHCHIVSKDPTDERLVAFSKIDDGLKLSQIDLKQRGPGEFLGLSQSGSLETEFIDFEKDYNLLLRTKSYVEDYDLTSNKLIKEYVSKPFQLVPEFSVIENKK